MPTVFTMQDDGECAGTPGPDPQERTMSTASTTPAQFADRPTTLRETARWIRYAPAPVWEGDRSTKATFAGYLGGSMLAWTVIGVAGSVVVLRGLEALAAALG